MADGRSAEVRVLFVCLGNICRSPTAEGVMRALIAEEGLEEAVAIESAGTGDWHLGDPPDHRATAAAADRGIELAGEARQVRRADLEEFDLVIAMDHDNLAELRRMAATEHQPKLSLLREFDAAAVEAGELAVPDPYFGGSDGFEQVLDLVHSACAGLLQHIREEHI